MLTAWLARKDGSAESNRNSSKSSGLPKRQSQKDEKRSAAAKKQQSREGEKQAGSNVTKQSAITAWFRPASDLEQGDAKAQSPSPEQTHEPDRLPSSAQTLCHGNKSSHAGAVSSASADLFTFSSELMKPAQSAKCTQYVSPQNQYRKRQGSPVVSPKPKRITEPGHELESTLAKPTAEDMDCQSDSTQATVGAGSDTIIESSAPAQVSESEESGNEAESDTHNRTAGGLTEYELERQRKIEENNKMLAALGLLGAGQGHGAAQAAKRKETRPKPKPRPKPNDHVEDKALFVRRSSRRASSRLQGSSMSEDALVAAALAQARAELQDEARAEEDAESSEFLAIGRLVMCSTEKAGKASAPVAACDIPQTRQIGGHVHAVYSMSSTCDKRHLAIGGGEGKVSFYPLAPASEEEDYLGSAKIHTRWVSHIQFVGQTESQGHLLLTASDDGNVLLSGVSGLDKKQLAVTPLSRLGAELHPRGVFGLDCIGRSVASCAKDGSVGHSRLSEAALQVVRTYDVHSGVAKCVAWQPSGLGCEPRIFASSGNDTLIQIYDTRSDRSVATIEGRHSNCVNSISFSPADSNLFVTASFDKTICVHDLRNTSSALHTLSSHHATGVRKAPLTAPIHYCEGKEIVTMGEKTDKLFSYSAATGELTKQMYVGFTPSCLYETGVCGPQGASQLAAAYGKHHIWLFDNGI